MSMQEIREALLSCRGYLSMQEIDYLLEHAENHEDERPYIITTIYLLIKSREPTTGN